MAYDQLSRSDTRRQEHIIRSLVRRGVVSEVDASKKMQTINVFGLNGHQPTKVEHWERYGFTAKPHKGAEVLVAALNGNIDHLVATDTADRRYRIKNLADGEVSMHDDQGQQVVFKRGGIEVKSALGVTIECSAGITLKGPVHIEGNMTQNGVHTDSNGPHTA